MPGVRINFGLRGISATVGVRGASVNIGTRGTHLNAGIPGSGLSYRTRLDRSAPHAPVPTRPAEDPADVAALSPTHAYKSAPIEQLGSRSLDRFVELVGESKTRREQITSISAAAKRRLQAADGYLSSFLIGLRRRYRPKQVELMAAYRDQLQEQIEDLEATYEANKLEVEFGITDQAKAAFERLKRAFDDLCGCSIIWDVTTGRWTNRRVERTVAREAIERKSIRFSLSPDRLLETALPAPVLANANGADLHISRLPARPHL
jgi:hypothetical protein